MKIYNKFIIKIDKFIHPKKYKCNNNVKPIKQLNVGDKLYVLVKRNLDRMPLYDRGEAMKYAAITSCHVHKISPHKKEPKRIAIQLLFNKQTDRRILNMVNQSYEVISNGILTYLTFSNVTKYSYTITAQFPYSADEILFTTNKERIIQELKTLTRYVKTYIKDYENEKINQLNDGIVPPFYYWDKQERSKEDMVRELIQDKITNFKQQYNDIIYKLKLL